jgi:parvulin-like peptidyl-prolyl isomerase
MPKLNLLWVSILVIATGTGAFFAGRSSVHFGDRLLATTEGNAVATWKTGRLTETELTALIAAEPGLTRSRLQDAAERESYVRKVVDVRLMAEEAIRRGLLEQPTIRQALLEHLARTLQEKEFSPEVIRARLNEAELQKTFDARVQSFSQPEKVRLAHIWLSAAEGSPDREAKRVKAVELLKTFRAKQSTDPSVFGRSASSSSDEVDSRSRAGDLGYLTKDQLSSRYGPAVADAAWTLQAPGALSDLLESPDGFHLLQLSARARASTARFEDVKATLAAEWVEKRQADEMRELTQKLATAAEIRIESSPAK